MACAACHREHHGAQADLTAIDNAACQSCHQQRYESFATDHPDFGNWPYERRTRIMFNHATHGEKHFAEKKQAFDCQKCHVADETGRVERLASYDVSCAGCHDEKIATSIARGVPMLALPTLDVAAFKKAGRDVGAWPAAATGDFDGRLPPMMKLLLAGDPKAAQAMIQLGPNFEFQDIDPDDTEQVAASADIAIGIQSLLADLSLRGPAAVRQRLSAALGRELTRVGAVCTYGEFIDRYARRRAQLARGSRWPRRTLLCRPPSRRLPRSTSRMARPAIGREMMRRSRFAIGRPCMPIPC